MPKINPLSFDEVSNALAYDPDTGALTWKIAIANNVKVGDAAGCPKGVRISKKTGKSMRYIYVRLFNMETPAARVAWLLHYGKFPEGNLQFVDGDTENLRINNLRETTWYAGAKRTDALKNRKLNKTAVRNYALKRYYGLSIETYNVMLAAQGGVCAICKGTENYVPKGATEPKPLSVDHNHETGEIRGLLCSNCNYVVGHCKENRNVLLEAIKYLDKYAGTAPAVAKLTIVPTEDQA